MSDNKQIYEVGKPCPYCGDDVLDGGAVGLYCSAGWKCTAPAVFIHTKSRPEINIYAEPEVKAIRKAAVEAFRVRVLDVVERVLNELQTEYGMDLMRDKIEALEVEG